MQDVTSGSYTHTEAARFSAEHGVKESNLARSVLETDRFPEATAYLVVFFVST